jgi:adenylate cyclase
MTGKQEGQRRLAAIMFTDMVGFSALAQRDEALAVDLLEEHRRLLRTEFRKYLGHEVKTIGDGFLIEFTSAVAAVDCAVKIQKILERRNELASPERRIHIRIGIHLGDVLPRGKDIVGDGVNIAARVEPLAETGGVAVTQQIYDQVYNKLPYAWTQTGMVELKNIERPLDVYRLAGVVQRSVEKSVPSLPRAGRSTEAEQKSIAVLPFVNMSSDRENEFLSDGISEDLLNALAGIEGLNVAARTSCFAFKGRSEDIRRIGTTLGVDTVLEGSVRKADNKLRITTQLINVADGFRLWSQSFDREMQDVFAIQDDITRAIMAALKLRLSGGKDQPSARLQPRSPEAYELYLKGRFFWNQRGIGLKKALHYFQLALIEDPEYALALSGLADTYSLLSWYGYLPPKEVIPGAIAAARRALQLDPQLAEAHTSLGFCLLCQDCDWAGAEREFARAIALNVRTVPARYWLGWLHSCSGNHDAALEHCQQAVELEPYSPIASTFLAWMHYHAGNLFAAEKELLRVVELDGRFVFGLWFLGRVRAAMGQRDPAFAALMKAEEISGGAAWTRCILGHAFGQFGDAEKASTLLAELQDEDRYPYVRAIGIGLIHLGLGQGEQALEWLEKACDDRDVWALMMNVDPVYKELRTNTRFSALLKRMGLAD